MQDLHQQVRENLNWSSHQYKVKVDLERRENNFEGGYMVLAHLERNNSPIIPTKTSSGRRLDHVRSSRSFHQMFMSWSYL